MEEKTIKKGDIMSVCFEVTRHGDLVDIFEKMPHLVLLMPLIGHEIESRIFGEKPESVTFSEEKED